MDDGSQKDLVWSRWNCRVSQISNFCTKAALFPTQIRWYLRLSESFENFEIWLTLLNWPLIHITSTSIRKWRRGWSRRRHWGCPLRTTNTRTTTAINIVSKKEWTRLTPTFFHESYYYWSFLRKRCNLCEYSRVSNCCPVCIFCSVFVKKFWVLTFRLFLWFYDKKINRIGISIQSKKHNLVHFTSFQKRKIRFIREIFRFLITIFRCIIALILYLWLSRYLFSTFGTIVHVVVHMSAFWKELSRHKFWEIFLLFCTCFALIYIE